MITILKRAREEFIQGEEKSLKIPMSVLKDKLRPEYRECYYTGEE